MCSMLQRYDSLSMDSTGIDGTKNNWKTFIKISIVSKFSSSIFNNFWKWFCVGFIYKTGSFKNVPFFGNMHRSPFLVAITLQYWIYFLNQWLSMMKIEKVEFIWQETNKWEDQNYILQASLHCTLSLSISSASLLLFRQFLINLTRARRWIRRM